MRRRNNVGAATLLVVGLTYLFIVRDGSLSNQISAHGSNAKQAAADTLSRVTGDKSLRTTVSAQPLPTSFVPIDNQDQAVADDALDKFLKAIDKNNHPEHSAEASPPDNVLPPPVTAPEAEAPKVEFPFQEDLKLDFPFDKVLAFKDRAPLHYNPNGPKSYTYATFMATHNPSPNDPYFLAILSLTYRLLYSPRTRTQKPYPFVVFVAEFVTQQQRDILTGAGAVVRQLSPLEYPHCDAPGYQKRWVDQFTKLNMWAQTDFSRILFLDADAFPLEPIDDMFDAAPYQSPIVEKMELDDLTSDGGHASQPYIFAGVPHQPWNLTHPEINGGTLILTPDEAMHKRLLQNYVKFNRYDCTTMEQSFLNWQFGVGSAYPPTLLERKWGGVFPGEGDEGKLKVVHTKLWIVESGWMREEWVGGCREMVEWFGGEGFVGERGRVG